MAKKMFLPARLAIKKDRWEIVYYQTDLSGVRRRFRETRDLNRIPDLQIRRVEARREIAEINRLLPTGYPFAQVARASSMLLLEAISQTVEGKNRGARENTVRTYRASKSVFEDFLKWAGLQKLQVRDFRKPDVKKFAEFLRFHRTFTRGKLTKTGISNAATNKYISSISSFFADLLEREIITENPFLGWKRLKDEPKQRRPMTEAERRAIFQRAYLTDRLLFIALLLQFFGFVRGSELRRLRREMFDFSDGVLRMPASITKDDTARTVTLPVSIITHLRDFLNECPSDWLIFGENWAFSSQKPCGTNELNRRFQVIVADLVKTGLIEKSVGLSFYSTKDTGISTLLRSVGVSFQNVMDQAGHDDPRTTAIYDHKPQKIEAIAALDLKPF